MNRGELVSPFDLETPTTLLSDDSARNPGGWYMS